MIKEVITYVTISPLAMAPFILMLGAIAVFPLFLPHFWDKNRNKLIVSVLLAIPTAFYLLKMDFTSELYDSIVFDYIPFIILLGSLFVITGGIFIEGNRGGTPRTNIILLTAGTLLASLLGTTGAAMLLIRPLLHTNRTREYKTHSVLFFIALVCNCGGLLTPLGDPPLFMMYLRGASFTWFFRLFPEWFLTNALLLLIYFLVDRHFWNKEQVKDRQQDSVSGGTITIQGKLNFVWLGGVVMAIALINPNTMSWMQTSRYTSFAREGVILLMALLSLHRTPRMTRISNGFTWHPINEVAVLFFGIFVTMVPCLIFLEKNAHSMNVSSPVSFYYLTGLLSSFLDNTPTAVTFHSLAVGLGQQSPEMVASIPSSLMKAICTAAVFFGTMTYIGNGPNFMVKTIAEHQNIKMPHFFEYMYIFSIPVLLPIFILVQILFI
ncbi:MAG: sodium:proton antiporter [Kiritimatiellae bacterium]|nr:sodium:proton antiporter [Kiritimatiellia bacterium]